MDDVIKEVEAAGWFWAVARNKDGSYTAVVARKADYIGDDLCGCGAVGGATAAEALRAAAANELKYEAEKAARR